MNDLARADSALVEAILPSPNHGERRGVDRPDCLILHYTGMADGASAIAWLRNPASEVSCHYVVEESGRVIQLVAEGRRAWHAGRSSWEGHTDINSRSIGIEIVNAGHPGGLPPYPDEQIAAVSALCRDVLARHAIRADRVLAHSDIAPGRKQDPGERFPWAHLHGNGVGLWVPARAEDGGSAAACDPADDILAVQRDLRDYGYGIETTGITDPATVMVVAAFQRHFRPARVDGKADRETRGILTDLLAARSALA